MPRAYCDDIKWDPNDEGFSADLPEDVDVWLDEGYCEIFEPGDTVAREFGCRPLTMNVEVEE
jgi:hypothetical protein